MPQIWKQVLAPGYYHTPAGPLEVTAADIRRFTRSGNEMVAAKLQIPIPEEHQDGAVPLSAEDWLAAKKSNFVRYNRGFIKGFRVKEGALECLHDIPDQETFKRLTTEIRYVSPEIRRRVDMNGKDWGTVITHVALTPMPVWHEQEPFLSANVVPKGTDGAALMDPIDLPLPYKGDAKQLSAFTFDQPIRLSMCARVVKKGENWLPTRMAWVEFQTRKGTVGAHWDSNKSKKLYGKAAQKALSGGKDKKSEAKASKAAKGKTSPKPSVEAAAAHAEKTGRTGKTGSIDQPMPKDPGPADRDQLHKLDVPALEGLAQTIDHFAKEVMLTPKNFASTRGFYTRITNAAAKSAKGKPDLQTHLVGEAIGKAIAADRKEMAKGKDKARNGALFAARLVGYRHMLDWAAQDLRKSREAGLRSETATEQQKGGNETERIAAKAYERRLEQPAAERTKDVLGDDRGAKFKGLAANALLNIESPYLKLKDPERWKKILRDGPATVEDRNDLAAAKSAALNNYRRYGDDAYPPGKVKQVLESLSNNGFGTLNPDEFHGLLRQQHKEAQATAQFSVLNPKQRFQLSEGGTDMADEQENDDLFDEDEGTGGDGDDGGDESEEGGASELLAEASKEAAEVGIMVPEDAEDAEDWIKHFITAVKTHKATKGDEDDGSETGGITDGAVEEQPQGVAMSANGTAKPKLTAQEQEQARRLSQVEREFAAERFANVKEKVRKMVRAGQVTPHLAKGWLATLETKQLSLVSGGNKEVDKVLAQIDLARQNPVGTFFTEEQRVRQLSHASEELPPEWAQDEKKKEAKEVNDTINRIVGRKVAGKK